MVFFLTSENFTKKQNSKIQKRNDFGGFQLPEEVKEIKVKITQDLYMWFFFV
jgi:hypothetical protein